MAGGAVVRGFGDPWLIGTAVAYVLFSGAAVAAPSRAPSTG